MEFGLLNPEAMLCFLKVLMAIGIITMVSTAVRIYKAVCAQNRDLRLSKHILANISPEERQRILSQLEDL